MISTPSASPTKAPHLDRAPALEQPVEREIHGARNVALPRVAVSACVAVELGPSPHVEQHEVVASEASAELVQVHVCHWLKNSRRTALNRSGCSTLMK